MGSGISPVVADLVMLEFEEEIWKLERSKLLVWYRRYRDDSILAWSGSRGELSEFLEDVNSLDDEGRMKFTLEIEGDNGIAFLDSQISIQDDKLVFRMYEKPYSAGEVMNFNSYQDLSVKRCIIAGETTRCLRISDKQEEDLSKVKEKLINNDYPVKLINEIVKSKVKKHEGLKLNEDKIRKDDKNYLVLEYPGNNKAKQIKKSR